MSEPVLGYQRIELRQLAEKMIAVRAAGMELLKITGVYAPGGVSVHPLGMALIEAADLFRLLSEDTDNRMMGPLFDGGESDGPNIETRLRCIRDYCSAAEYALRIRSEGACDSERCPSVLDAGEGVGEETWLKYIAPHINSTPDGIMEVARLLDDVLESTISIFRYIEQIIEGHVKKPHEACCWEEIHRHAWHIQYHFDYAEEALISCLRVASE